MTTPIEPVLRTAQEFEEWYAANSGVPVALLHSWGRYGKPCDCGDDSCRGWQMAYREER